MARQQESFTGKIDWLTVALYTVLALFGWMVIFLGVSINHQKNWLKFGSFTMQPSEFAKFGVSLALAKFMSGLSIDIRKWKDKWKAFAVIAIPMAIVLIQGDAGSAIVFVALA